MGRTPYRKPLLDTARQVKYQSSKPTGKIEKKCLTNSWIYAIIKIQQGRGKAVPNGKDPRESVSPYPQWADRKVCRFAVYKCEPDPTGWNNVGDMPTTKAISNARHEQGGFVNKGCYWRQKVRAGSIWLGGSNSIIGIDRTDYRFIGYLGDYYDLVLAILIVQ